MATSASTSVKPRGGGYAWRTRHPRQRADGNAVPIASISVVHCRDNRQVAQRVIRLVGLRDDDVDLAKRRVRRGGHRLSPCERDPRLHFCPLRHRRRRRIGELRARELVLGDPQRERARLEQRRAVGALRERAHAGGKRNGHDGQRDQHLDQREATSPIAVHGPVSLGPADRDAIERIDGDHRAPSRCCERERERLVAPDARRGTITSEATARPANASAMPSSRLGQRACAQHVVIVDELPAIAGDIASPVAQHAPARGNAEHFVSPLRALCRVFQGAREAARFTRRQVPLARVDQRDRESGRDTEDHDDDEDLDQREAGVSKGPPATGPTIRCRHPPPCRRAGRRRRR